MLDEFEIALSQSEKLRRKRKAEDKRYKCIMAESELHDSHNGKRWKQYGGAKQKKI